MIRKHVVGAVFRRNFVSYFSSPTGYVFIFVFIVLCSVAAFWQERFYVGNLANFDALNRYFPYLLLFFVPAVTMALWSEERKQGTDELLLTLPVTDLELILGKYLAALGIYSVALLFALTDVAFLWSLGRPDMGVLFGTYLGYWFLGGALLAIGMVGSLLTSSMTVAFIMGALFCAVPIFTGDAGNFWEPLKRLGVGRYFGELGSGVLSLQTILYFAALTVLMLYLSLILLARRHLRNPVEGMHWAIRALCVLVSGVSLVVLAGRSGGRADLTSERLHTLMPATREVLKRIDAERPVQIHAFVSPEVPETYVQTRETLLSLLREFEALAGGRINLKISETRRYTAESREAEEKFGIKPEEIMVMEEGGRGPESVFLGVGFTSGALEDVIPFLHRGLSVEYELTRSIGVVSGLKRRKVGIAGTDVKVFGGFDFQSMRSANSWQIVDELKKQYEVTQVSLDQPVTDTLDVLFVPMPSTLPQPQMDTLMAYIRKGRPVLLLDDPHPGFNPSLAPSEPRQGGRQQMPFGPPPPPQEPKGNIGKFMETLGIRWGSTEILWDFNNPHPMFKHLPLEFIFVGSDPATPDAFNPREAASSELQEMVFLFAGTINPQGGSPLIFTPLLKTTKQSGTGRADEIFARDFLGRMTYNSNRLRQMGGQEQTIAARIQGTLPAEPPATEPSKINAIMVADMDFVGEQFFNLRQEGQLNFDNVTFILNCVDVLAGDESFVAVRKRRLKYRTLEKVEARVKQHRDRELAEGKEAEEAAKKQLQAAQDRLNDEVKKIRERTDLDARTKDIFLQSKEDLENRRLEVQKKIIDDEKSARIERSKEQTEEAVRSIQNGIKIQALIFPPLLALAAALIVFVMRLSREGKVAA